MTPKEASMIIADKIAHRIIEDNVVDGGIRFSGWREIASTIENILTETTIEKEEQS